MEKEEEEEEEEEKKKKPMQTGDLDELKRHRKSQLRSVNTEDQTIYQGIVKILKEERGSEQIHIFGVRPLWMDS